LKNAKTLPYLYILHIFRGAQGDREVEKPTWSEEKVREADLSQGPAFSSPERPAREQEAQEDYTLDPALEPTGSWQIVPDQIAFQDYPGQELAPVQQAGQIISWADLLSKNLAWQDQEWNKVEKLLGCFPRSVGTAV
jgi:hypothetical protein